MTVVLLYAVCSSAWILLSDKAVAWLFDDPASMTIASTLKGWLFVAVTTTLLYVLIRRLGGGKRPGSPALAARPWSPVPFLLVAFVIVVLVGGAIFHTVTHQRDREVARLQAIADLKARQIADWLDERVGDAEFIAASEHYAELYRRWRDQGEDTVGELLRARLKRFQSSKGFSMFLPDRLAGLAKHAGAE